ncbi:LysR family transcriptional regulator [Pseudomonas sp. BN411]|uniref:LysR family transcriptional regulator n=1 Tax=Pseudomonas sp. BN411 TaxID=2567887 RepID=UPI002455F26A|nr:LysR family transcriptional regulator [Pseudomonas sp. BN411]MDH4564229.1 LysR family transcriptional regulator [Pseudomonas sp. BN411]
MNPFESHYADQIAALLALSDGGSFVAAGKALQRHPTIISKRVAELETRLGIRLVERTTRHLRFTEAGTLYVQHLQSARDVLLDAEQAVTASADHATGTLRLALPAALGRTWLAPIIAEFTAQHPTLTVHAEYSDLFVDIITEGFDAAIRVGELPDSRLKAKKLCDNHRILCASPDYLAKHGTPKEPADLATHNCLGFTNLATYPAWKLSNGRQKKTVLIKGSLTSNDNEALLDAALQGLGVLAGGDWLMSRDLLAGRLVHILSEWKLDIRSGIYFVRPSARNAPAKTKVFKEWIERKFAAGPPWST